MKTFVLLSALLLTGCVIYPNTYNAQNLSPSKLSHINFDTKPILIFGDKKFHGKITGVWDKDKKKVIEVMGLGYGTKSHDEVFLQPGEYLVQAYCYSASFRSNPHIVLTVEAGITYTLGCVVTEKTKDFLGGEVPETITLELVGTQPIDASKK